MKSKLRGLRCGKLDRELVRNAKSTEELLTHMREIKCEGLTIFGFQ
jgi:hypothetical protein